VRAAIFYHDAIYDPKRSDNEEQSAHLAKSALSTALVAAALDHVTRLILATDHKRPLQTLDEELIVDIDLSILGREPEVFDFYDRAIRLEYAFVPEDKYRVGRTAVLNQFLNRPQIYSTPYFQLQHETQSRVNLIKAIAALRV
jgi:predicted metal-dependent HD superfamily phosphohydrolase